MSRLNKPWTRLRQRINSSVGPLWQRDESCFAMQQYKWRSTFSKRADFLIYQSAN